MDTSTTFTIQMDGSALEDMLDEIRTAMTTIPSEVAERCRQLLGDPSFAERCFVCETVGVVGGDMTIKLRPSVYLTALRDSLSDKRVTGIQ